MRPVIALLLTGCLMIGGCDRQSNTQGQASESVTATATASPVAAASPAPCNENVTSSSATPETIGTLKCDHVGESAPDVTFEDPTGAKVTLASFRGKPVLLNLWATWCAPCVGEMPTLDALAESLDGKVQVLTISQDLKGAEKVTPFFQKAGFHKLQPYLDTQAAFSTTLQVNLPTTILYDSNGKEVWRMLGGMDWTGQTAKELIAQAR